MWDRITATGILVLGAALVASAMHAAHLRDEIKALQAQEQQRLQLAQDETDRIQQAHKDAQHAADLKARRLAADLAGSRAEHDRLRQQLEDIAPAADPAASAPASGSATPDATRAMLAHLLGRCSERRQELALFADRAQLAANTCARAYAALTPDTTDAPLEPTE